MYVSFPIRFQPQMLFFLHFNQFCVFFFAVQMRNGPEGQSGTTILEGLREYSLRLLASVPSSEGQLRHPLSFSHLSPSEQESFAENGTHTGDKSAGELTGCREAVEILTRTMRKGEGSRHLPFYMTKCVV